jgi:hypothetical protein
LTTLLCEQTIVAKPKEVKTGCKLAESPKVGFVSNGGVLPVMTIIVDVQMEIKRKDTVI